MDKNTSKGARHEIHGAMQQIVGKVTGNKAKELAGDLEKNLGTVQRKAGEASDDLRAAAKPAD